MGTNNELKFTHIPIFIITIHVYVCYKIVFSYVYLCPFYKFQMNNHLMTTEAMINPEASDSLTSDPMRSGNSSMLMHQDTSVISAHDVAHTGIYDILGRLPMPPPNASSKMNNGGGHGVSYIENQRPNSIDPVQGYFFRKKLLMQDANETRL